METGVDTGNASGKPLAPRRRRFAAAVLLVLAAGVAIVLGTRSPSPRATANPGSAGGVATVQRRDLVEADTESGTLGFANPQTVYNRLNGTVTWLPAVGMVIDPGQTLYSVNGRPVVLFDGALAAYRALSAKDSPGLDLLQLNRDLAQMGFADGEITIDDAWQAGTTDSVERWQASLGEKQTGEIALGRIVFLPGAQRITQLETTCGSTGGGSGSGSGANGGSAQTNGCGVAEASATTPVPHSELVDFTTESTATLTTTTSTTTTTTPTTTPTTTSTNPRSAKPPSGHKPGGSGNDGGKASGSGNGAGNGSRSGNESGAGSGGASGGGEGSGSSGSSGSGTSSSGSAGGGGAEGASAILQTTSTKLVVTVDLAASSQSEAVSGSHVTVEMPNGATVGGTITAVSAVAQDSSNSNSSTGGGAGTSGNSGSGGSSATVPVTIALDERVKGAGLDQAAVSVNFVQEKARNVLSVPVTALIATAGESYAVQETGAPYKLIPVTTGLFAAGYVQISGAGVHSGLQVTDSQG